jgi:hypothetical protein
MKRKIGSNRCMNKKDKGLQEKRNKNGSNSRNMKMKWKEEKSHLKLTSKTHMTKLENMLSSKKKLVISSSTYKSWTRRRK